MTTPKPLTMEEIEKRADKDIKGMFGDQEPVSGPITLYEAMARAIKYNLDHRVKIMEKALAAKQTEVSRYDLLPKLASSAGYNWRNNEQGSSSVAVTGPTAGVESLVNSTSQERHARTADISIMWNVLDFGVSYIRARQQCDQLLIIEERRRKVIQNIIQDLRYAYWRAAISESLVGKMMSLLDRTRLALERSRKINKESLQAPRKTLEYQKALLENIRLLWGLIQKLKPAKKELAALINISPGSEFQIATPELRDFKTPQFRTHIANLEHIAMIYRPELREEDYKGRISALDARKAILNMLPGLNLNFGYNYDSNKFLYNSNWWDAGAGISLNIFQSFLSGPASYRVAKTQEEVGMIRRRALSMAVLAQVHLAYQHYTLLLEEYLVTDQLDMVNNELNVQTIAAESVGRTDELSVIRDATNALLAKMRHYLVYGELQNAAGRIYNSIGIDFMPETVEALDVKSLTKTLEASFDAWDKKINTYNVISIREDMNARGKLDIGLTSYAPEENQLTYEIVDNPSNGIILNFNSNTGEYTYRPNRDFSGVDAFSYKARSEKDVSSSRIKVKIIVSAVNDVPTIEVNGGIKVERGEGAVIGGDLLKAADADNLVTELTCILHGLPAAGTLKIGEKILEVGDRFTQEEIDKGLISYSHDGSYTTPGGFSFIFTDSEGGRTTEEKFIIVLNQNSILEGNEAATAEENIETYSAPDEESSPKLKTGLVQIEQASPIFERAKVTVGRVNVRLKPSPKSRIICNRHKGDVFRVLDRERDWIRIELDAYEEGWIYGSLVKQVGSTTDDGTAESRRH